MVAEGGSNVTAVEDEVTEESTGTVLHEDTLVLVASSRGHLEDDVHEGSGLGDLPVNTGGGAANGTEVNDEVANGPEAEEGVRFEFAVCVP